jgi:hypothetical protein
MVIPGLSIAGSTIPEPTPFIEARWKTAAQLLLGLEAFVRRSGGGEDIDQRASDVTESYANRRAAEPGDGRAQTEAGIDRNGDDHPKETAREAGE